MTLLLNERDVAELLNMKEMVGAVEEAFRQQGLSNAVNSPRTRSAVPGSSLNVMHASLPYLHRAGVKSYMSSKEGNRFVFTLFDTRNSEVLAVMGADVLGRNRTGAASAVATKHLCHEKQVRLGICGSGWQALTQVLAIKEVKSLEEVRVYSPNRANRERFASELASMGFHASAVNSPGSAFVHAEVGSSITSSGKGFIDGDAVRDLLHLNVCGANSPDRSEALPSAVSKFQTIVVDDLAQAKYEGGDLIQAEKAGVFSWERAIELKDCVTGRVRPQGKTFFKSHGAALEDVAGASLIYDKAKKAGGYRESDLTTRP